MYAPFILKRELQLSVALLIALDFTFSKTVDQFPQSSFSGHFISSNCSFGMSWLGCMLHINLSANQSLYRLSAVAEALLASSKAEVLLCMSYRWPSCLHIPTCWDCFCCHMMSLADIQLVTTPDPAKLLSSQSFPTLYLSSWNAEMNVELLICFFSDNSSFLKFIQSLIPDLQIISISYLVRVRCKYTISIPPSELIMKILNRARQRTDSWEILLNRSF